MYANACVKPPTWLSFGSSDVGAFSKCIDIYFYVP